MPSRELSGSIDYMDVGFQEQGFQGCTSWPVTSLRARFCRRSKQMLLEDSQGYHAGVA